MATRNRVQCSLIIDDDDVYNGFVKPLQRHHQLGELIVRLLISYYKNDKVKDLVDSSEPSSMSMVTDAFKSMHETLAVMDYYIQEGENAVEDGKGTLSTLVGKPKVDNVPKIAICDTSLNVSLITIDAVNTLSTLQRVVVGYDRVTERDDIKELTESIKDFKDSMLEVFKQGVTVGVEKTETSNTTVIAKEEYKEEYIEETPMQTDMNLISNVEEREQEQSDNGDMNTVDAQQSLLSLLGSLG